MTLKKIRLGDYLIPYKEKCGIPDLTPYDISGVNKDKEFFEPSRQTGEDTTNYQNVPPGYFACNLMHVGRDKVLPIAYNHTSTVKHVSPAYSIFRIKENNDLLDYYFFIYLTYFCLCWVFVAAWAFSNCKEWGLLLLRSTGSRALGLQ